MKVQTAMRKRCRAVTSVKFDIYTHIIIGRWVSLVGGQLSVPSRCTAVYTWLLTASVASGRGDPALLSCVDPVSGNLGLPLYWLASAVLELSGVGKPALR